MTEETWLPAISKEQKSKYLDTIIRPCVLRFKRGQLQQLWVCRDARKAEWRKIPKEKEK